MSTDVIHRLGNLGIRYHGEYTGLSLFEGIGNKFKAAVDLTDLAIEDAISAVTSQLQQRRDEWMVPAVDAQQLNRAVPMRIGPHGGFHVLIDGQWMRVRKE